MPDLNSLPPSSPHSLAPSRRQSSQQMPPPPIPTSPSLNILPSNQTAVNNASSSSLPSPSLPPPGTSAIPQPGDNTGVGPGPGPLRHPRPLTAAELHLELEKEQEAVVNRLTRELSILRAAQNASVVSNTSSTSASASGAEPTLVPDTQPLLSGSGFSIPSSGRRHNRTASNASARSITATTGSGVGPGTTSLTGISAPAPIRPIPVPLSRQNSSQSRRSQTGSPAPHAQSHPHSYTHSHLSDQVASGYFHHRSPPAPTSIPAATPGSELSPGILPATSRYEETAFYRQELEVAKRENDALKRRIRDLERMVRERRSSDASRTRSESVSTTASVSVTAGGPGAGTGIAGPREGRERVVSMLSTTSMGVGVPEDEVRVGESAASAGLRN
ncbi:hypothetical protein NKR23_g11255 [Pleurostoma richardsiae]|uniref:Uncharacterized protein n=1 Tax=Pleurostoma richardsiae TaxID=41990 RepID=A0AA38R407_9PEZI|nr:hypothetical protein NKR23_g11255 [Pleurostoma richardsiae]